MEPSDDSPEDLDRERQLFEELVEVYRTTNEMEANRAIVEVLSPGEVDAFRRDRVSRALPAPTSETGGYFIAVPEAQAGRALELLAQALEDAVLDGKLGALVAAKS